jgi:hypothetical protein
MTECPAEKPICFRTEFRGTTNKKIVFRCNGEPYDVLDALKNAYEIKTNADVSSRNPDRINQCKPINDAKADPNADCSCLNFDFAWMTAIAMAKSRIEEVNPDTPVTNNEKETAKTQIQQVLDESKGKRKICGYFEEISKSMRNNAMINNGINTTEITTFCDLVDRGLADAKADKQANKEDEINVKLTNYYTSIESLPADAKKATEKEYIYFLVYNLCLLDENMDDEPGVGGANAEMQNEDEMQGGAMQGGASGTDMPNILNDLNALYHVGIYVINESTHFDKNAFETTRDSFKQIFENNFLIPAEQGGGGIKNRLAYAGYRIKRWGNQALDYASANPFKFITMVVATAASFLIPVVLPITLIICGSVIGLTAAAAVLDSDLDKIKRNRGDLPELPEKMIKPPLTYSELKENNAYCKQFKEEFLDKVKKDDIILWKKRHSEAYLYNRVFTNNRDKNVLGARHIYHTLTNRDWFDSEDEDADIGRTSGYDNLEDFNIPVECNNNITNLKKFKIIKNTEADFNAIKEKDLLVANKNAPTENNLIMKRTGKKKEENMKINDYLYKKDIVYRVTKIISKDNQKLGIELKPLNKDAIRNMKIDTNMIEFGEDSGMGVRTENENKTFCLYHPSYKPSNAQRYTQLFTLIDPDPEEKYFPRGGGKKNKKHTKKKIGRRKRKMTRR